MKQNRVFVLDANKKPLSPCHPARARELLSKDKAAVYKQQPFTIILKEAKPDAEVQGVQLKVDPGSKTTGLVLVSENEQGKRVVWAAELEHRGEQIKARMLSRRQLRRGRRSRKMRYRPPRFDNRKRLEGWLPPSLQSRVDNVETWVRRLRKLAPVASLSVELAKFDTQKMENPEIDGVEYQQGELQGYNVRQYLLEKWDYECAYCGARDVPLEVEHIIPQTRGGSDRVSNLTISCVPCNREKGNQTAEEFGFPEIQKQAKRPLRDAAIINATRWHIYDTLKETGLSVEVGTGARTKYNRHSQGYPKAHWIDAACVGKSGSGVYLDPDMQHLSIKAAGHGKRQRCGTDKYGFPIRHALGAKTFMGFQTGDLVRAVVPNRLKSGGTHVGRISIRYRPSFRLNGHDVHPKYMEKIQGADGYEYATR